MNYLKSLFPLMIGWALFFMALGSCRIRPPEGNSIKNLEDLRILNRSFADLQSSGLEDLYIQINRFLQFQTEKTIQETLSQEIDAETKISSCVREYKRSKLKLIYALKNVIYSQVGKSEGGIQQRQLARYWLRLARVYDRLIFLIDLALENKDYVFSSIIYGVLKDSDFPAKVFLFYLKTKSKEIQKKVEGFEKLFSLKYKDNKKNLLYFPELVKQIGSKGEKSGGGPLYGKKILTGNGLYDLFLAWYLLEVEDFEGAKAYFDMVLSLIPEPIYDSVEFVEGSIASELAKIPDPNSDFEEVFWETMYARWRDYFLVQDPVVGLRDHDDMEYWLGTLQENGFLVDLNTFPSSSEQSKFYNRTFPRRTIPTKSSGRGLYGPKVFQKKKK